jgi:hypothetical protein
VEEETFAYQAVAAQTIKKKMEKASLVHTMI